MNSCFGFDNCWIWIIIIFLLVCCCGGNGFGTYLVVAAMAVAIAVVAQTGLSGLLSSSFSSVASKITDHSANPKL